MDSHLHIARGPFVGHVRGGPGFVCGCVELEAKARVSRAQGYELHVLAPAACTVCATPLSVPVKRHRALHLQH